MTFRICNNNCVIIIRFRLAIAFVWCDFMTTIGNVDSYFKGPMQIMKSIDVLKLQYGFF